MLERKPADAPVFLFRPNEPVACGTLAARLEKFCPCGLLPEVKGFDPNGLEVVAEVCNVETTAGFAVALLPVLLLVLAVATIDPPVPGGSIVPEVAPV